MGKPEWQISTADALAAFLLTVVHAICYILLHHWIELRL